MSSYDVPSYPNGPSYQNGSSHGRGALRASGGPSPSRPPGTGGEGNDEGMDFGAIWHAIWAEKWIVLATTVVVLSVVGAYTVIMEPIYQASSIVSVDTRDQSATQAVMAFGEQRALQSEIGVLRNSVRLAERVVGRLDSLAQASERADSIGGFPLLQKDGLTRRERALQLLHERMEFVPQELQEMIVIRASSPLAEEAAALATLYAEAYRRFSRQQARMSLAASRRFLQEQAQMYRDTLNILERQRAAFARAQQMPQQGEGGERLIAQYQTLQSRRRDVQLDLQSQREALKQLKQQLQNAQPRLEQEVRQEGAAAELRTEIEAINKRLASLRTEAEAYYAEDSTRRGRETNIPELERIKDRIDHYSERKAELTNQLVAEASQTTGNAEAGGALGQVGLLKNRIQEKELEIDALEAQVASLGERIDEYSSRLDNLPGLNVEREQMTRKIRQAEQRYSLLVKRLQEARMTEEMELGYVNLVRQAAVPAAPVRPDVTKNLLLGLLLGLGLGAGLGFVRYATRERLETPGALEARGLAVMGVVPEMRAEIQEHLGGEKTLQVNNQEVSTSLMTLLAPWSPVVENFRRIRTSLKFGAKFGRQRGRKALSGDGAGDGSTGQVLVITSPDQNDGKSTVAANLAISMARGGQRTLLVDADLRRPILHRLFGVARSPGLSEVLDGERAFRPEEAQTAIENFSLLTSGRSETPSAELLDTETMRALVDGMRDYYDAVIIDTPPVLAVTDPLILAAFCDAVSLVVAAGKTTPQALGAACEAIRSVEGRLTGTVLNRFEEEKTQGGYGYGYYERYEARDEEKPLLEQA